jgi:hypothetical protein
MIGDSAYDPTPVRVSADGCGLIATGLRPHLKFRKGQWQCQWGATTGRGDTPLAAWTDLQRRLENDRLAARMVSAEALQRAGFMGW